MLPRHPQPILEFAQKLKENNSPANLATWEIQLVLFGQQKRGLQPSGRREVSQELFCILQLKASL